MTTTDSEPLDAEELMHLALRHSRDKRPEKAISNLKQILKIAPEHGKAHYFLGALHADIGMYERAVDDMRLAIKYEPDFSIARFQLGLLLITSGQRAEAESIWSTLDNLGESNPLFLFKCGILQLAENHYQECISNLEKGMSLNTDNDDLNGDMQHLIDAARQAISSSDSQSSENGDTGKQSLLSAYQRSQFETE